jgi:hypothetical protein
MSQVVPWTCPTCHTGVASAFCPDCGEKPLRQRELTLRGLVEQMFEAFTNIDSKLVRSLRALLTRPGQLTVAFLEGRRKAFLSPVALFLLANVLFFAMESFTGSTVFTTPLDSHLHRQPWSGFAPQLVAHRLATLHTTLEQYAPVFDRAVALKARSLIICMALSFAFAPMLVFLRSKRPLVTHAVFSLHLYAFLLLLMCVGIGIQGIDGWRGGGGVANDPLDHAIAIALLVSSAVYLFFSTGTVYGTRGVARVLKTLVLTVAVGAIVLGYRFVLLLITLYTT